MDYPGHIVDTKAASAAEAAAIRTQLAALGYAAPAGSIGFDRKLAGLIALFQSQHVDVLGRPLVADGRIGPLTWAAMFGAAPVAVGPTGLAGVALAQAIAQVGVRESPEGSNRGAQVDAFNKRADAPPGSFWCMAFVYWCFDEGAKQAGKPNTFPKTAGCIDAWNQAKRASPGCIITREQAIATPSLVRPGLVFILDHGGGLGHTGFVRQATGGALRTVEGNSNNDGSRNGVGVFELNRRKVTEESLRGFLDFTAA